MNIPFYRADVGSNEYDRVKEVMSGEVQNSVEQLEEEFASYIGVNYAIATSHGTSALHLAMLALNLKRGDKVICSVNAYPAVPEVVRHFDAEPVFMDIEESSYNMNLDQLEAYLMDNKSRKLKAVIVSHIAGEAVNLERLYSIARIYGIKVIEDASDALGATYNGEKIGSLEADMTCFSFMPHLKNSVCSGGMLVTNDDELHERATLLRNHAMVIAEDNLHYIYDIVDIGSKYTMSELDSAFISAQLEKQDKAVARQKEIAKIYDERLGSLDHVTIPKRSENHSYSMYIIKVDKNRDSFARELAKKKIETGLHYIPLHLLSYYKNKYSFRINDFPVALRNYQQILSIPIYSCMSDKEVDFLCKTVADVAKNRV